MLEIGSVVTGFENGLVLFDNGFKLPIVERTVEVFAFTGMRIGELEVVDETNTQIELIAKTDGKHLLFDKATGLQINCEPRFANKIYLS